MNSSTGRVTQEQAKQADIRQQIALLQAQLRDVEETAELTPLPASPKRKRNADVLVPPTPSPKKRRIDNSSRPRKSPTKRAKPAPKPAASLKTQPASSTLLSKMADIHKIQAGARTAADIQRSSAFTDAPAATSVRRDDRLAIIEDLEPGPVEHSVPADDPKFLEFEPNSGIRLSSRSISHEDLQEYLRGRYYLSPSRLYSCIQLLPNKQGYDVPVSGDWITIAVVAERGPIKLTRAPVGIEKIEGETGEHKHFKKSKDDRPKHMGGKKYVNIKLVDFGARSKAATHGGKSVIRGDALLTLLLFESDSCDIIKEESGTERKIYKGGSRGAFESMSKIKEGDVIAMLNPKLLKPQQNGGDKPHPTNNVLAVNPESASSIMVIGRCRDLGMCVALKKDGKVCGSWCDKRVSDVCEWHLQNAVKSSRAARPEFSISTSGMSTTAATKHKSGYDPSRQWGLKPTGSKSLLREENGGGSTYVVSGHIVSNSNVYMSETMGREGQAKATRKKKDMEEEIQELMKRDKTGKNPLLKAIAASSRDTKKVVLTEDAPIKTAYSANMIKNLGFDPATQTGHSYAPSKDITRRKQEIESILVSRKKIELGPRPGPRVRSGVIAPIASSSASASGSGQETPAMVDLDDD